MTAALKALDSPLFVAGKKILGTLGSTMAENLWSSVFFLFFPQIESQTAVASELRSHIHTLFHYFRAAEARL